MAWTGGINEGRKVLYESLAQGNAGSVYSAVFKTGRGENFSALINLELVNTTGAIVTTVEGSHDGVVFVEVMASFTTTVDTLAKVGKYLASVSGDYPFYRINYAATGDNTGDTLTTVLVGDPECEGV